MTNDRITDAQFDALTAELDRIGNCSNNQALWEGIRAITSDRSAVIELSLLLRKHATAQSAILDLTQR